VLKYDDDEKFITSAAFQPANLGSYGKHANYCTTEVN
jgi:hypothetical protein